MVAINIGHSPKDPGAVNTKLGITEYQFNLRYANKIKAKLDAENIPSVLVHQTDYSLLARQINQIPNVSFIVSLHINAATPQATGSEVLYFENSVKGKKIASIFQSEIVKVLQLANRGIKPRNLSHRGGGLLYYTIAPCIITEPFFISNEKDVEIALEKEDELIEGFIQAIKKSLKVV